MPVGVGFPLVPESVTETGKGRVVMSICAGVTAIVAFVAGRDWHNPDSWICSELVAAATEAANLFPKKIYVTANGITPKALALEASAFSDPERLPDYP